MARKPQYRALAGIDKKALAAFQAGIRKRYTDEQILAELKQSSERLGRSPTMREFAADAKTTVHPQTVIEHFGSWNRAKRKAGLVPRRFATREELLAELTQDAHELLPRRKPARDEPGGALCLVPAAEVLDHRLRVHRRLRIGGELTHRR